MSYVRTQIYLDPDDHRRLSEEAKKQGKSLTALLREIVRRSLAEGPDAASSRSFDAIVGIAQGESDTNVAEEEREYLRAARQQRLAKKLGRKT